MPRQRVRIVTDSVADLPPEVARRLGIAVVPVYLQLGNASYRDTPDLEREWVYRQLARGAGSLKTASPPPQEFQAAFEALAAAGAEEIVGLFLSTTLSSICSNARLAAAQVSGARVQIVETGQVTMGLGWLAVAAAEAAAQGASADEIAALIARMRPRTYVVGVLDTLEHLAQSGRVPWAAAWVGELLKIKPLIRFHAGEATLVRKVRTQTRALDMLAQWIGEARPLERLALIHSRAQVPLIADFAARLATLLPGMAVQTIEVSPVFGVHIGAGGLGVAYVRASGSDVASG